MTKKKKKNKKKKKKKKKKNKKNNKKKEKKRYLQAQKMNCDATEENDDEIPQLITNKPNTVVR